MCISLSVLLSLSVSVSLSMSVSMSVSVGLLEGRAGMSAVSHIFENLCLIFCMYVLFYVLCRDWFCGLI